MGKIIHIGNMIFRKSAINVSYIDNKTPTELKIDVSGCQQLYSITWPDEETCKKQFDRLKDMLNEDD